MEKKSIAIPFHKVNAVMTNETDMSFIIDVFCGEKDPFRMTFDLEDRDTFKEAVHYFLNNIGRHYLSYAESHTDIFTKPEQEDEG